MNENKNKNIKQDQGSQSDTRTPPSGQPMRSPGQEQQPQRSNQGQQPGSEQDQDKRRQ